MTTTFPCHDVEPRTPRSTSGLNAMKQAWGGGIEAGALNLEGGWIPNLPYAGFKRNALVQSMLRAFQQRSDRG